MFIWLLIIKLLAIIAKSQSVEEQAEVTEIITKLVKLSNEAGKKDPDLYDNFYLLRESIKQHNISMDKVSISNPTTVISADEPHRLVVGFACVETERKWGIKIAKLTSRDLDQTTLEALKTREGKDALAYGFSCLGRELER